MSRFAFLFLSFGIVFCAHGVQADNWFASLVFLVIGGALVGIYDEVRR